MLKSITCLRCCQNPDTSASVERVTTGKMTCCRLLIRDPSVFVCDQGVLSRSLFYKFFYASPPHYP